MIKIFNGQLMSTMFWQYKKKLKTLFIIFAKKVKI